MYFDALTLAAVTDELRATILGGRVQRVLLTGPLGIGLEIYAHRQRYQLLASAHPQFARVHLVHGKLSRGVPQATPLLLLLRKYVLAGRIAAIEQPPLERMLVFSIVKETESRNHHFESTGAAQEDAVDIDEAANRNVVTDPAMLPADDLPQPDAISRTPLRCELIIEPMERRSNIILVDDNNLILDSIKRVTPQMSQRVILPRQPYIIPPRQNKRDPHTATAAGMATLRETAAPSLVRAIVQSYRGVSPQVAREVVQRALGTPDAPLADDLPWDRLAFHLQALWTGPWEPTLVPGADAPQAYAPYVLTFMNDAQPQPGISAALETYYEARESVTAHRQYRGTVQQQLDTARDRLQHQQHQLEAERERLAEFEQLRWEGEMIFAFLHTLAPGQPSLEVEGQTITLDPDRSPVEVAQQRFRAYDKAKSAQEGIPERLEQTRTQLAGLEQLAILLELADTREQVEQIAREAAEQGYVKPDSATRGKSGTKQPARPQRKPRLRPLRLVSSDGFDIYVGRSSEENAEVTFRIGRPDDLWLHVRTIPGGHVIVRSAGRSVPEQTIQEAAGLAAYFSQVRHEHAVDVDLAHRSQVRKIAGGSPGLVTYQAQRTLRVAPLPPWG